MTYRTLPLSKIIGSASLICDGDWVESKDQDPNGNVRLVQLADIGDGVYLNKSARFLMSDKARELKCTFLKPGDILVSRMADPIGRACIFPGDAKPCVTVVDACIVRPDESVVFADWLKYAINSPSFRGTASSRAIGATRTRISRKNLQSIEVPIAPLDKQRRIVDILSRAEGIVRLRREAQKKAAELIPVLFLDMFGDPATNPKRWPTGAFGSVGTLDRGKSRHRPRDAKELYGSQYPFIQTGDVANSGGRIKQYNSMYSEIGLAQSKLWPAGTLCITIAANIAKTGVLEFDSCFPDSVVGFLPSDRVKTEYVQTWLGFLQPTLEANAPQAAQKNINLEILRGLPILTPPIALQETFKRRCLDVYSIQKQQATAMAKAEATFNALLAQAFSG